MWRMADEPILCFDGDDAGRRAAYRALDLALPLVKPGKSLKFAALPDGQDPDDLVRSGGREAVEDVLAAARPLADMLWARESEAGPFDTPERRAALEARLARGHRDHRRRDGAPLLPAGFRRAASPIVRAGRGRGAPAATGSEGRWDAEPPAGAARRQLRHAPHSAATKPYVAASPQLAASPLHRGHRTAIPRREALILQAALNHPWLLHDHLEELAEAEFRHADTQKAQGRADRRAGAPFGQRNSPDDAATRSRPSGRNSWPNSTAAASPISLARIERTITTPSVWGARPEAARERCFADLEAACCLASAVAFPN